MRVGDASGTVTEPYVKPNPGRAVSFIGFDIFFDLSLLENISLSMRITTHGKECFGELHADEISPDDCR